MSNKIISQECITKYKLIVKAKKAESFQAEIKESFFAHRFTFLQICRNVQSHSFFKRSCKISSQNTCKHILLNTVLQLSFFFKCAFATYLCKLFVEVYSLTVTSRIFTHSCLVTHFIVSHYSKYIWYLSYFYDFSYLYAFFQWTQCA